MASAQQFEPACWQPESSSFRFLSNEQPSQSTATRNSSPTCNAGLLWLLSAQVPLTQAQGPHLHGVICIMLHVLGAAVTCHAALCQPLCQAAASVLQDTSLADPKSGTSVLQIHSKPPKAHQATQRPDHSWCSQNKEVRLQACGVPAAVHRALFQAYMGCSQAVSACKPSA